jgi:hypothetical protein
MDSILYDLVALLAALTGVLISAVAVLPPPILGALVALGLCAVIYRAGWNAAVDAVWSSDVQKAGEARRSRRR